jgi:uncharacterized protein (DUF302 family)
MTDGIGLEIEMVASHAEAVDRVMAALKDEGFGVLTRVDLHDAFKEKLGVDFRKYSILGACNPPLAHRALTASAEIGLLLPCNVTVEATAPGQTTVRIVNPLQMMKTSGTGSDPALQAVAHEAAERLHRVAQALGGQT